MRCLCLCDLVVLLICEIAAMSLSWVYVKALRQVFVAYNALKDILGSVVKWVYIVLAAQEVLDRIGVSIFTRDCSL